MNAIRHADAPVEANQVCAAAEQDVLTVIDDLIYAGMQIGRSATTQVSAPLDKVHAKTSFGKCACSAHAGYATTNNGDCARFAPRFVC